jgi:hypothetical protein
MAAQPESRGTLEQHVAQAVRLPLLADIASAKAKIRRHRKRAARRT